MVQVKTIHIMFMHIIVMHCASINTSTAYMYNKYVLLQLTYAMYFYGD